MTSPNSDKTGALAKNQSPFIHLDRVLTSTHRQNYDKNAVINNLQYRKLCSKLGCDLTSFGQLVVNFKSCDRLPESVYSINLPHMQQSSSSTSNSSSLAKPDNIYPDQTTIDSTQPNLKEPANQMARSASSQQLLPNGSSAQQPENCFIYLTASMDDLSMKTLLERQICKQDFPTFEFDLVRTNLNQSIGLSFIEIFFVNRTEVAIQKIFPNSLASTIRELKKYDIVYSINNIQVTSIKSLNKIIQKAGCNSKLRFVTKRPCVLLKKPVYTSEFAKKLDDLTTAIPTTGNIFWN